MRVLITGAEGFVGQYLTAHLREKSYEVYALHLLPVSTRFKGVKYERCDILSYRDLREIVAAIRPEGIFHLAAISAVGFSFSHPEETLKVNFCGTYNLLRAVVESSLSPRIIFISSADVYGRVKERRPIREESELRPVSPYGLSKVLVEECAQIFWREKGVELVILRPFSHTGVGQREDFVFPYCAKRIAEIEKGIGSKFLVLGNLNVRRDYLDVRDVVSAYELAFRCARPGEVYNIATGKPLLIKEGVRFLLSLAKRPIKLSVSPRRRRQYDIPYLSGDSKKFQQETGWRPKRDIKETLKDLLAYYRKAV